MPPESSRRVSRSDVLAWLRDTGSVVVPGQPAAAIWSGVFSLASGALLIVLGAGFLLEQTGLTRGAGWAPTARGAVLVLMYALLGGRLVAAAIAWPQRRRATVTLASCLGLLSVGAILVDAVDPAPREVSLTAFLVMLAAQFALATFIVLDGETTLEPTRVVALDTVIICGGASSFAGFAFTTPLSGWFTHLHGHELDQALLFPAIALVMLLAVVSGTVLGRRRWSGHTAALGTGLTLLLAGNLLLMRVDPGTEPIYTPATTLLWGLGFFLATASACGPRSDTATRVRDGTGMVATLLASCAAGAVLTVETIGEAPLLVVPAAVTMAAAMARMALALHDARGAAEAYRLSLIDDLTDLPNRRAVLARIQVADSADESIGLLLADLDEFKIVNDTLGHPAGDQVLRTIARRLREVAPAEVMLGRPGGDEFIVVLPILGEQDALAKAAQLREVIARPLQILGHELALGSSVGVSVRHPGTTVGDELLRQADVAMYQAKSQQTGTLLYHADRDDFTLEHLEIAADLRRGLPDGQIHAWYQPQVNSRTFELAGIEALVRWQHPDTGLRPPGQFLPVARRSGLMPIMTEIILDTVLADIKRLLQAGIHCRMSFNVAPAELLDQALIARLLAAIDRAALAPGTLVLEITEDSLLADPDRATATLHDITSHGLDVAIDDYGAGFSSLAYLRDLPVGELKLDRSFVTTVASNPRSRTIVASTASLAQGLGLRTVAEGVEDAQAATILGDLGIDVLQGFHFARPMPYSDLRPWILSRAGSAGPHTVPRLPPNAPADRQVTPTL
ncbi:bifunctional diguanylate cyclase/phosphodiesterase [Kineosporia sp. NBRC 101731]|uniref:putative bifunctional diguanylate cyclase/phosphodiesterase n=1 Tax=Kineosporia sp. NBRC 101731 TaxID=3032199 RepID=UPI0024A088C4|nr:bifunctional diguanylate cyclase/phosphodiesterase [Kineosporia sp. NBRC 101731]GLY29275.1 hypothetical protein Kisp02_26400 [Kineosporia sp. NBRC 101731]